jgi:two-component system nitrogen regulation response regulator NtrX
MSKSHILIVDDEHSIRDTLQDILEDEGYLITTAANAELAHAALKAGEFDLILLDIWMPDVDGITLLKEIRQQGNRCPVVMISGHGTVETAVEAIQYGAYDYLEKPLTTAKLLVTLNRALQSGEQAKQITQLKNQFEPVSSLVGNSQIMAQLRDKIKKVGQTQSWVMITGPAGSGKDVIARALHRASSRNNDPFVKVSLAAIPPQNIARRLFGSNESGATQLGCFEQAEGGILYLDEIGDLDSDTQTKLLSALQAGRFMRVGGQHTVKMDVRIVSSTSYPLDKLVSSKGFRADLFYRLNVMPIKVPPLRAYLDDIPSLAEYYVDRFVQIEKLPYRELTTAATNRLRQHSWPGNVRELINSLQQLLIMGGETAISAGDIDDVLSSEPPSTTLKKANTGIRIPDYLDADLRQARDAFEKMYFEHHLNTLSGNVSALAKVSGLERTHLYRKFKALNINPKEWK